MISFTDLLLAKEFGSSKMTRAAKGTAIDNTLHASVYILTFFGLFFFFYSYVPK